jgi:hypothetical protein
MEETGIRSGVSGAALVRAADAMLRSLGGTQVRFLLPQMGMPNDPSVQLGLVDPGVEEVNLAPVVVRNLPTSSTGPRRRLELLIPTTAISQELNSRNLASAQAFFDSALGVVHDSELLHIEGVATEYFAGTAYLYRVVAVD